MRWVDAMDAALYGPSGFYRREHPGAHFRTSVSNSVFASALAHLVQTVDAALGHPARLDIVDLGAADGRLLVSLLAELPTETRARAHPVGVELRTRPSGLPPDIRWSDHLPDHVHGLVLAHEYLDNVPCDVVEATGDGLRLVVVDPATGEERTGPFTDDLTAAWLDRWWPLTAPHERAESGARRDAAWADVIVRLDRGVALAVDYGHLAEERLAGGYSAGTLTGYRSGHQVPPVPDGSCDVTAHVAMDACAASGIDAGATSTLLTRQADALRALGLRPATPPLEQATSDPHGYVQQLSRANEVRELLDRSSLGSFWWLVQTKGCPVPIDAPDLGRRGQVKA